jgi:hypothetical protein
LTECVRDSWQALPKQSPNRAFRHQGCRAQNHISAGTNSDTTIEGLPSPLERPSAKLSFEQRLSINLFVLASFPQSILNRGGGKTRVDSRVGAENRLWPAESPGFQRLHC